MELLQGSEIVAELPVILVIEDDELVQSLVVEALIEGGFEPAIAASGEEAVTLLKSSSLIKERLVTYRGLVGHKPQGLDERLASSEASPRDRPIVPGRLHDRCGCRAVGFPRRAQQHSA
jgi:ActR/RegA family two-component response regulator